jgi:hypothetical protein
MKFHYVYNCKMLSATITNGVKQEGKIAQRFRMVCVEMFGVLSCAEHGQSTPL